MKDSRRLRGSFEHDFCSCGQQRNWSFQKFACAELNLVSFLLIVVYLSREEFDCRGESCYSFKDFSFEISRNTAARDELCLKNYFFKRISMPDCCKYWEYSTVSGDIYLPYLMRHCQWRSIAWGNRDNKTTVWSFVTRDSFLSADTIFKLVIFNICIQFLYFAYDLWYLSVLSPVSILLMFVIISLKNCANIIYHYRLLNVSILLIYHVV